MMIRNLGQTGAGMFTGMETRGSPWHQDVTN